MNAVVDSKLPNSQVRRHPERGSYDRESAYPILDAGQIAHVGFTVEGQPYVIPMLYVRMDDLIYLHGSVGSRLLKHLTGGHPCCLTVTHVDGLVLARSHFSHSVNYRSVAVFGHARALSDLAHKGRVLACMVDALIPGRAADGRPADTSELVATSVLEVAIDELSVKVRSGGPKDLAADMDLRVWAGVLPQSVQVGAPLAADDLPAGIALPAYLSFAHATHAA